MVGCGESNGVQRLVDEQGRPLGWIVRPRQRRVVGPLAGTVLLHREGPIKAPMGQPGAGFR